MSPVGGLSTLEGAALSDICISEKALLMDLFRKQRCTQGSSMESLKTPLPLLDPRQLYLAKLIAVSVGYCWKDFSEEDWRFTLSHLRIWIQSMVIPFEELAETVDDAVINASLSKEADVTITKINEAVGSLKIPFMDLSRTALFIVSLLCGATKLQIEASYAFKTDTWSHNMGRILEDILRLFFATGVTEAVAGSYNEKGSLIVSRNRIKSSHFWKLIAMCVNNSSGTIINNAMKSVELWGLSSGALGALYAILFTASPLQSLQCAAFNILSAETLGHRAVMKEAIDNPGNEPSKFSSEELDGLREEISVLVQKSPSLLLGMDLVAQPRVMIIF